MLVLCGLALMCALTAAVDVTTQPAMDVTQLLQQLQTEIQEFRGNFTDINYKDKPPPKIIINTCLLFL